ncbi:MAG TPA: type II toxin-antitoxin system RelE/ParE family toxin [bacterium]|nr:type II toxin-antitoxin system RelE/ParE family toxin [bacterium]
MNAKRAYAVSIKRSAEKEMDRLPADIFDRIASAILDLETNPRPPGCKKLRGIEEYRLRVGPYRVLYTIDDPGKKVFIISVGHRR